MSRSAARRVPRPKPRPRPDAPRRPRVAVVVSRYNDSVTGRLLQGARDEFARRGLAPDGLEVFDAPGSFELPVIAASAVATGRFDGVVTLGCIQRGETPHDRVLADAVASALASLSVRTGVPVGFGVLTVDTAEQALARAGGSQGNKGAEAMAAVLDCIGVIAAMRAGRPGRIDSAKPDKSGPDKNGPDKNGPGPGSSSPGGPRTGGPGDAPAGDRSP